MVSNDFSAACRSEVGKIEVISCVEERHDKGHHTSDPFDRRSGGLNPMKALVVMDDFDRNASQFLSEPVAVGLALGVVPMLGQRRPFFDTVLKDVLSLLRRIYLAVWPAVGLVVISDTILDDDTVKRVDFRLEDGAAGLAEIEELGVVAA